MTPNIKPEWHKEFWKIADKHFPALSSDHFDGFLKLIHNLLSQRDKEIEEKIEGMKKPVEWRPITDAESHIYSMKQGYREALEEVLRVIKQ